MSNRLEAKIHFNKPRIALFPMKRINFIWESYKLSDNF